MGPLGFLVKVRTIPGGTPQGNLFVPVTFLFIPAHSLIAATLTRRIPVSSKAQFNFTPSTSLRIIKAVKRNGPYDNERQQEEHSPRQQLVTGPELPESPGKPASEKSCANDHTGDEKLLEFSSPFVPSLVTGNDAPDIPQQGLQVELFVDAERGHCNRNRHPQPLFPPANFGIAAGVFPAGQCRQAGTDPVRDHGEPSHETGITNRWPPPYFRNEIHSRFGN
ncbi:MAG TPA: hypothetical protein VFZ59_08955 [Verrucomicrobiae bacterium]|nr:hypothetical protein [Verrucomicrobiae bacterium]